MHKKYLRDFYPGYNLLIYSYRIVLKTVTYPIVLMFIFFGRVQDKGYGLLKPLLDLLVLTAFIQGTLVGSLSGAKNNGVKVKEKVPFLEEQSISALFKKAASKFDR